MPFPFILELLDKVGQRERLRQLPLAQLTWLVGSFLGSKGMTADDWLTGYARAPKSAGEDIPKWLEADLATGLALGLVSQEAYDGLTA